VYREFYLRGKGFTTEDMIGIINRLTKRDYHAFYRKYVSGVEVPNYEAILGYAGYNVDSGHRLVERTNPTPDQLKLRGAWLKVGK